MPRESAMIGGHQVFIIGPDEETAIRELREWAAANPIEITPAVMNRGPKNIGAHPAPRWIDLGDYRVSYTIDLQPAGPWRHLALSCREGDPHPYVVAALMRRFEFINPPKLCPKFVTPGSMPHVLNVTEPLDGKIPPVVAQAVAGERR